MTERCAPFFDLALRADLGAFELDVELVTDEQQVGVFGPSGAGKTTLVELITGWRRPARGHVRLGGRTVYDGAAAVSLPPRARGIGYVPQDVLLFPHWSVRDNLTAGVRYLGGGRDGDPELLARVLDALGLRELERRAVDSLSGGESRRVALGRALLARPRLLVLDEPLASLDRPLARRILGYLVRIREEFQVPMLVISHDMLEVQALCSFVVVLAKGAVRARGRPEPVLRAATLGEEHGENFENLLRGRVTGVRDGTATVALASGVELAAPRAGVAAGERVLLSVRADDILVAADEPRRLSARNVLRGRIRAVVEGPGSVGLEVVPDGLGDDAAVAVNITDESLRELGLRVGAPAYLVFKARSVEVVAVGAAQSPAR